MKVKWKGLIIGLIYYLSIGQKQTYTRRLDPSVNVSNISHMDKIAELFKTKIKIIVFPPAGGPPPKGGTAERNKDKFVEKVFEVRTDKIESKIISFDYFKKYPLFGYKYFALTNCYAEKFII